MQLTAAEKLKPRKRLLCSALTISLTTYSVPANAVCDQNHSPPAQDRLQVSCTSLEDEVSFVSKSSTFTIAEDCGGLFRGGFFGVTLAIIEQQDQFTSDKFKLQRWIISTTDMTAK